MGLGITKCLHCGAALPAPKARGRPRIYCSNRCRVAEQYRRRRASASTERDPEAQGALRAILGLPVDPDEALAQSIVLAYALVSEFRYLAPRVRPEFAGRCALVSQAVEEALGRRFPEVRL